MDDGPAGEGGVAPRDWEAERRRALAAVCEARDALLTALADCVAKATEYGQQGGGFVASYILPTGPIHRAIPLLDRLGVTVRPGFDGRQSLTPEQAQALADYKREMQEHVIPAIVETLEARQHRAAELRLGINTENSMSNFEDLRLHVSEARGALAQVSAPSPENDNPLYYPLLFLTETAEAVLRHALKEAHAGVAEENKGAAAFIASSSLAVAHRAPRPGE